MKDLGVEIFVGEDAVDQFEAGKAEEMRKQSALAFARLEELLIWLKREHDKPKEGDK